MLFPIAIHKDDGTAYGVIVPDVPGCFSAGDTIEEAIGNAKEAIYSHIEVLLDLGQDSDLKASSVEELKDKQEYEGAIWAVVEVNVADLDPTPERVNVSLPRFVLRKIDKHVKEHHDTRSGFLARAAMDRLSA